MIHTNRCKHCGKTKEEHLSNEEIKRLEYLENAIMPHPIMLREISHLYKREVHPFYDSGLAALDAHKEELYEACMERKAAEIKSLHDRIDAERKIFSILNQIEKEK